MGTTSCGSSLTLSLGRSLSGASAATYVDDLYGVHDRAALREAERLAAEKLAQEKAEQEKRIAAMVAATNAGADIDEILDLSEAGLLAGIVVSDDTSSYQNIYVDDYASAYARRLQGFTSITYRMPSSYWNFRYSDAYFLTLAYDPAFYTVMVMGDQVWVEPRYITNMFGSWNNPYYYGYRYGYNPYYYGYSYGYWDYWGWNSPYWACDPFFHNPYYHPYYYGWYSPHHHHNHHHHHPAHRPGGPGDHKKPNVTHRPGYGNSAGGGSSMRPGGGTLSYNDRLGGRGGTQIVTNTKTGTTTSSSVRPSVRPGSGNLQGGTTDRGTVPTKPTTKGELSSTLSGTTINTTAPRTTRGSGTSGVSNSSSRSTRSSGTATRSSSSGTSQKKSAVSSSSSSRSSSSSSRSYSSSSSSTSRSSYSSSSSSSSRSYSSGSSSRSSAGSSSRSGSSSRGGR